MGRFNKVNIEACHALHLAANLMRQRKEGKYCDVCICVDERRFLAHKTILSANSSKLDGLIMEAIGEGGGNQDIEIEIQGVSSVGFEPLLEYFYSGNLALQPDTVMPVWMTAAYLDLPDVVRKCSEFCKESVTCVSSQVGDNPDKSTQSSQVSSSSNEVSIMEENNQDDVAAQQPNSGIPLPTRDDSTIPSPTRDDATIPSPTRDDATIPSPTRDDSTSDQVKIPETRKTKKRVRKSNKRKNKSKEEPVEKNDELPSTSAFFQHSNKSSKVPTSPRVPGKISRIPKTTSVATITLPKLPKTLPKKQKKVPEARKGGQASNLLESLEALEDPEDGWEKPPRVESISEVTSTIMEPSIVEVQCDDPDMEFDMKVEPGFEDMLQEVQRLRQQHDLLLKLRLEKLGMYSFKTGEKSRKRLRTSDLDLLKINLENVKKGKSSICDEATLSRASDTTESPESLSPNIMEEPFFGPDVRPRNFTSVSSEEVEALYQKYPAVKKETVPATCSAMELLKLGKSRKSGQQNNLNSVIRSILDKLVVVDSADPALDDAVLLIMDRFECLKKNLNNPVVRHRLRGKVKHTIHCRRWRVKQQLSKEAEEPSSVEMEDGK